MEKYGAVPGLQYLGLARWMRRPSAASAVVCRENTYESMRRVAMIRRYAQDARAKCSKGIKGHNCLTNTENTHYCV